MSLRTRQTVICDRCRVEVALPIAADGEERWPPGWCHLWTAIASRSEWHLCPECDRAFRVFMRGETRSEIRSPPGPAVADNAATTENDSCARGDSNPHGVTH